MESLDIDYGNFWCLLFVVWLDFQVLTRFSSLKPGITSFPRFCNSRDSCFKYCTMHIPPKVRGRNMLMLSILFYRRKAGFWLHN